MDADRTIDFDYIGLSWATALLLFLPFLKTNKWLNGFIFYVWILSVYKTQNSNHRLDFPIHVLLSQENQNFFFMFLLLFFVILYRASLSNELIFKILSWLGVANLFLTVGLTPVNRPFISGIVFNKSMNSILNLMLVPFVFHAWPKSVSLFGFFTIATVMSSNSSSALFAMILMLVFYFRKKPTILVGSFIVIFIIGCFSIDKLFQYQDRLDGYDFFFKTFTLKDWVIGRGPGAFFPFSTYEQVRAGFNISRDLLVGNGLFIWLHSDPLQAVYEYGVIGGLLLIPCVIYAFRFIGQPGVYSLVALLSASFLYYPHHYPIHLVVIFLLLKICANNYKSV